MTIDIDARKCAALAVRLAAALEESVPLVSTNPLVHGKKHLLLSEVRIAADWLLDCDPDELEDLVRKIPARLRRVPINEDDDSMAPLVAMRGRLVQRLKVMPVGGGGCAHCLCRGCESADETATSAGPCIREIIDLMHFVQDRSREIYQSHAPLSEKRLHVVFGRADAESGNGMLPSININGWTDVQRHPEVAMVGLEIRDRHFDWTALCQTLYVFVHEMVCHAYQGLRGKGRRNTDEHCDWSEGWMDSLAWTLTEEWIDRREGNLPGWLNDHHDFVKAVCSDLHSRRYKFPHPGFINDDDMESRRHARRAFQVLRDAFGAGPGKPKLSRDGARERAQTFSVLVNLHPLDDAVRGDVAFWLTKGLIERDEKPDRFEQVLGACSEFCDHRDPDRLLEDLRESVTDPRYGAPLGAI